MKVVKVNQEVLKWARETMGLSVEDAAKKVGKKPDDILAWEAGEEFPTYIQLEKLAHKAYKRPVAIFFFPSPPEEPSINKKFRSLPETYAQALPPQIRYLIRKALARQIILSDLFGEIIPNDIREFKNHFKNISHDAQTLATNIRIFVGVSLREQFTWDGIDNALKNWRRKVEDMGVWVFKEPFKDERYCGFFLGHENFPVIYINNSMPKQRQLFTLFHELGHLLLDKSGIDFRSYVEIEFQGEYQDDERFCNDFAGSFLVPDDDFPIASTPDDITISTYAQKYKVSREVILRKCLNRNLITAEYYNNKVTEWRKNWEDKNRDSEEKEGGGNYYASQKTYLGEKYLKSLFKEYYQQRIDEYKLADYLDVKVKALSTLEGYMLKGKSYSE